MLIQIKAPYFVAGLVLSEGKVIKAAPIIKYMIGWDTIKIRDYSTKKGWEFNMITNEQIEQAHRALGEDKPMTVVTPGTTIIIPPNKKEDNTITQTEQDIGGSPIEK